MTINAAISFAGAMVAFGLACLSLWRDARSFTHRAFALGMIVQGIEAALVGLCVSADSWAEVMQWEHVRSFAGALVPAAWLLFSLSFASANYREVLRKWSWVVALSVALPMVMAGLFKESHFAHEPIYLESSRWVIPLGWSGIVFHVVILLGAVLVLMNLERTLRTSVGQVRWQIKFLTVGLGGLMAARVYTESQTLLFRTVDVSMESVNGGALLIAAILICLGLSRARLMNMNVYPSHSLVFNSFTILIVGIYLLAVGGMAQLLGRLDVGYLLPLQAFFVFLAFLGLAVLLLSDRLRYRMRLFIWSHLKRPHYDYRQVWIGFSRNTSALVETGELCRAVAQFISRTFELLSVSVWLLDESRDHLVLAGSTGFPNGQAKPAANGEAESALIRAMKDQQAPVDFDGPELWAVELKQAFIEYFQESKVRYCLPLKAGGEFLGLMTLGERVGKVPFTPEELELLRTIGDQAAASLQNVKLGERLRQAREMAAFQAMSAFFVHDLKNLASTLSLLLQNLPVHYDNPEFRKDALALISANVEKIGEMTRRLSSFREGVDLNPSRTDVDAVVREAVAEVNGSTRSRVKTELGIGAQALLDPGQVKKVLLNLILNADEATADGGQITVSSAQQGPWAIVSVIDQGCGMSREFIRTSLFQPFKTTKKKGLGIGLYQSKAIVEAHGGRIEVESEEGRGTTFRVLLPLDKNRV